MTEEFVAVADVVVGVRSRKDYGDLTDLMESIREYGLLQPIGLAPDDQLLFGGRRLEAVKRLGWDKVKVTRPMTQTDALSLLKAERDENTCRKDMTPEELVDLGMRLEELERPKAAERKREGQERGREARWSGSDPAGSQPAPARKTAQVVGEALGLSRNTYRRLKTVVTTARDENAEPDVREVAQEAVDDLNDGRTTATAAYNRVNVLRVQAPPAPTLVIPQPPKMGGNRRKHLEMLEAVTTGLSGYALGLDSHIPTGFDSTVTPEEAARLLVELTPSMQSLNRIKRLLKERAES